jgi:RND family efflux transporter MFP subunit
MKVRRLMVGMRHCGEAASIAAREIEIRPSSLVGLLAVLCLGAGCKEEAVSPPLAQVRVATAKLSEFAPTITLTGVITAQVQADHGFRLSGKISECYVDIGDHVTADQVLAKLDPVEQQADVDSAKAGVRSAEALLAQNAASLERLKNLVQTGNATRHDYDQATAAYSMAQAQLDQARAQLGTAQDNLSFTKLHAGAAGIIVARNIDPGQVVAQAQPAFVLAQDGPRDAVFNVYEWALTNLAFDAGLTVSTVTDSSIKTVGDVREISAAVNPNTMTVTVRIGLRETPAAMSLGSVVNGTAPMRAQKVFLLPWGSLFEIDGKPAVWVVDPKTSTVALKPVVIDRYNFDTIAVTGDLEPGQSVVFAGGQMLRPGQKVQVRP